MTVAEATVHLAKGGCASTREVACVQDESVDKPAIVGNIPTWLFTNVNVLSKNDATALIRRCVSDEDHGVIPSKAF